MDSSSLSLDLFNMVFGPCLPIQSEVGLRTRSSTSDNRNASRGSSNEAGVDVGANILSGSSKSELSTTYEFWTVPPLPFVLAQY